MVSDRAFIFHIYIPYSIKVKVICQCHGQISRLQFLKKWPWGWGALVSHKHSLLFLLYFIDPNIEFPSHYPVGCLLGCVDVVDCLAHDDYEEKV